MSLKKYVATRTLQSLLTIWVIITVLFFMFRLMPGDFTQQMAQQGASQEALEAVKERWGLNDPLHVQYFRYMKNLVQLDMGESVVYRVDVWEHTRMRIFNTFILVAPGITVSYLLGGMIGTLMGNNRGGKLEKYGVLPLIAIGSVPAFFTGIFLIVIFSMTLDVFPTSGMISPLTTMEYEAWWRPYLTVDFASHYVLPFTVIVLRYTFFPAMLMRTSVVEVLGSGHMEFHRLSGIPRIRRLKHLAKHASLPLLTMYPMSMARALGGLVLVETVFNWPGIGFTVVKGVLQRDFPVVLFVFAITGAFVVITNFLVDLLYGVVDPRISVEE